VLRFSATHPEVEATEHWQEFRFQIDARFLIRIGLINECASAVEEWTIINEHKDDHVFHIHINDCK